MEILKRVGKVIGGLAAVGTIILSLLEVVLTFNPDFIVELMPKTEVQYTSGVETIDGYVSTFLGYKFTAPEGCEILGVKERAELAGATVSSMTIPEMEEKMQEQNVVVDLLAAMPSGTSIVVMVHVNEMFMSSHLEAYVKEGMSVLEETGVKIIEECEETEYLGRRCATFTGITYIEGIKLIQEGYVFVENGYAWMIVFSYPDDEEADKELLVNAIEVYELLE